MQTNNETTMQATITTTEYFGGCPRCGKSSGYVNHNWGHHWGTCDEHRTAWYIGYNMFSSWKDEPDEERAKADELLAQYELVEPVRMTQEQYEAERRADNN